MAFKNIYSVKQIDKKWNRQMLQILKQSPVETPLLTIVFDREPDIFAIPEKKSTKLICIGLFIRDRLAGFAMMLDREVLIEGRPQTVLYFGNMAVHPFARGKGFLYRVSDAFMKNVPDDIIGYAVIMQGNRAAKQLLNRFHPRYPNMPHSRIIGQWHVKNILLTHRIREKKSIKIRRAQSQDINQIMRLLKNEYTSRLFAPHITDESFRHYLETTPGKIHNYFLAEKDNKIVGVCRALDMGTYKQNRVLKYGKRFKWITILYKLIAPLFHFPKLPSDGQPFRDITITDYAVKNRDADILQTLLAGIYNKYRQKQYHMLIIGFSANDPLLNAVKGFFSQSVISDILIFSKSKRIVEQPQDSVMPFIDMELL